MKKTILIILGILMIGLVTAQVITNIDLNLDEETKEVLTRVGKGIGSIQKERMLFDENGTNYANETYIDELKLINQDCEGDYCHFKLFEEGGINKEFKVKIEKICIEFNETEEGNYCINYRIQTTQEIQLSAEAQAKKILNHIASVTLRRERGKVQIIQEIQYYSCLSKSISKAECPAGLSGGKQTRCYLVEAGKSPWDYCAEGWIEV